MVLPVAILPNRRGQEVTFQARRETWNTIIRRIEPTDRAVADRIRRQVREAGDADIVRVSVPLSRAQRVAALAGITI